MKKSKKVAKAKTPGLRKFARAVKKKAAASKLSHAERRASLKAAAKKYVAPAPIWLKPIAPALGVLVDSATGKPFGPTRLEMLKLQDKLTPAERKELLKLAPRPDDTRWPSEITVGKRFRKAMGGLDEMAHSIERRTRDGKPGLLQPIGITPKDELIWGERRLLGWKRSKVAFSDPIPVRVLDVHSIIEGEYVENDPALRKNFTPEEAVEIVRAMRPKQRELVGAEAAARPPETRAAPGRKASGKKSGRVADRAAAFVGKDRKTIAKAEAVVDAAAEDPAKYGRLRDDMNRTGKVDGPFRRLEIMRATDAIRNAPPPLPGNGPYKTAVIDFPWPHEGEAEQEEIDAAGRSLRPYPAMSIRSGCHYLREQVAPLLDPVVTVWFWVTNWHLVRGYHQHLLAALGFPDGGNTMLTWEKDKIGRGQILRDKTEHCIVLTRGQPVINVLGEDPPTTVLHGPRRENSRKPDEFYRLVERVSPAPRYASIFSTGGEGELWDGHGDQVEKNAPAAAGDEQAEWKALGAVEAGVTIVGPVLTELQARKLISADVHVACGWILTDDGAERFAALDAKFKEQPAAPPPANPDALLWTALDAIALDPTTALEPDWLAAGGMLDGLVSGKKSRKLTARGRKRRDELVPAMQLGWLEAVQAGAGPSLPESARESLHSRRYVSGITAKHLTPSGVDLLAQLREDRAIEAELAGMPAEFGALLPLYVQAQRTHHDAVLRNDGAAVEAVQLRLDAIEKRANDLRKAPDGSFDWDEPSGRDRLVAATRAPIGEVPMWAQQGAFRIEVAGMPALVRYDPWIGGSFGVYAEDGTRPFISDTGCHSYFSDDTQLGCTVAQYAERFLREEIETPLNKAGSRREARKPKDKLPLPRTWHRLPSSWDEVDGDDESMPIAGGERFVSDEWKAAFKGEKSSPAEDPQPADRADEGAPAENENLSRTPKDVIDAIEQLGGHTVSMTVDHVDASTSYSVATCQCKWSHRVRRSLDSHTAQDAAIDAHWREMLGWAAFSADRPLESALAPAASADDWPEIPPELRRKAEAAE